MRVSLYFCIPEVVDESNIFIELTTLIGDQKFKILGSALPAKFINFYLCREQLADMGHYCRSGTCGLVTFGLLILFNEKIQR